MPTAAETSLLVGSFLPGNLVPGIQCFTGFPLRNETPRNYRGMPGEDSVPEARGSGMLLPQSQLPSKLLCLPGVGGWGLRRASRREVRTLRRFRKDRSVQFSRGRRTLCIAGGRGARPQRGLGPERASQRRKRRQWEREPRAASAPRIGQRPQG